MRLYLAVAVLVLAFVAYSEAQEQTFEEKMTRLGEQMSELGKNLAEKAKTTLEGIHSSPFAQNARNWLDDQFSKLKEHIGELSPVNK